MLKSQERGNLARNRLGDSLVAIDFRASHFVNGSLQPQIMTKTRLSSSQKRFSQLPGKQMLLADESHKGKYGLIAELKVLFSRQCLPSKSCAAVHLATVTVESDCGCKICHENLQKWHFKIKNNDCEVNSPNNSYHSTPFPCGRSCCHKKNDPKRFGAPLTWSGLAGSLLPNLDLSVFSQYRKVWCNGDISGY